MFHCKNQTQKYNVLFRHLVGRKRLFKPTCKTDITSIETMKREEMTEKRSRLSTSDTLLNITVIMHTLHVFVARRWVRFYGFLYFLYACVQKCHRTSRVFSSMALLLVSVSQGVLS